ncbi:MAG: hypothetical protein LBT87_10355 [Treponema sp.]|jgi:hypothetical protein|nr:hypothetical protein [Treponema sp.]
MDRNHFFLLSVLALLPIFSLGALDLPTRRIEDDSSLRISLREGWLTEVPARVLAKKPLTRTLPGGGRIEVRAEAAGKDEFLVILARELNTGEGGPGNFPGWAQGSWILTRRRDTGAPTRIRVFPRSDPYTYVQFFPLSADKCRMDMVIYDAYVIRSLPLPVPFEGLLTLPVEELYALAGHKFPRRSCDPDPANYRDLRLFMSRLRERLPELEFRDDGAFDENGRYVYIETLEEQGENPGLNCSGFTKWVVDGILRPVTGERLPITPLKAPFGQRGSSLAGIWEELRDPFFGLDWTRNLASRAMSVLRSPAYSGPEEFEVRNWPFSQVIIRQSGRSGGETVEEREYPGYLENSGFGFEGLQPLLYALAIDEPGRIYLASVNNETGPPATRDNPRGLPRIRQHFHVAVLVPYFNEYGNFQVAVFESAEETRFSSFRTRYPGHNVNLVRIPAEGSFDP